MENGSLLAKLSEGLVEAVANAASATVRLAARRRFAASGIVWSTDGLIVTANHVVEREDDVVVGFADGRDLPAKLVGRDPSSDIALLKVEQKGLAAAQLAGKNDLRVGHLVVALGRPSEGGVEASMGIVSAVGGPWRSMHGGLVEGYLRTDVTMYPGFSGGPLIDTLGRLVGLNSSSLGPIASVALPVMAITRIAEALRVGGRVAHGYLGVRTQQVVLPAELARILGLQAGLLVMGVEPGGPADQAGVMLGDVLATLAGQPIRDPDELQAQLGGDRVGTAAPLVVVRGGERRELSVTIGERP